MDEEMIAFLIELCEPIRNSKVSPLLRSKFAKILIKEGLTRNEIIMITGISRSCYYLLIRDGIIPKKVLRNTWIIT